jgi:ketosteroid isomerase-like protein
MDDIYAINLAKSIFREGFNQADVEQVLSIYDDGYADLSFGLPSFYSTDANDVQRARLKRLFEQFTADMSVMIIDIVVNGDKALDWGWHHLVLTNKQTSEKLVVRTRYFETWRRDAERGWLVSSFIDNLDEQPRLPEEVIAEIETTTSVARITRLSDDTPRFVLPDRS